tara:strand:- start:428 stop:688 length:261 start_codon:yes stop_codon:yes gene_type:complete
MTDKKPKIGSPEHIEQVRKKAAKLSQELFNSPQKSDFDEAGVLSGSADSLEKTDAELFPDEIEEYTPEERRKRFKVHTSKSGKNKK